MVHCSGPDRTAAGRHMMPGRSHMTLEEPHLDLKYVVKHFEVTHKNYSIFPYKNYKITSQKLSYVLIKLLMTSTALFCLVVQYVFQNVYHLLLLPSKNNISSFIIINRYIPEIHLAIIQFSMQ